LYPRNGGSGFHIGLVYKIIDGGFETIEGNTYSSNSYIIDKEGCATKLGANEYGILTRPRTNNSNFEFLHIEELYDNNIIEFPSSEQYLSDSCTITTDDFPEEEGDFEGEEARPKSDLTTEQKALISCGTGIIILGLIAKFRK